MLSFDNKFYPRVQCANQKDMLMYYQYYKFEVFKKQSYAKKTDVIEKESRE